MNIWKFETGDNVEEPQKGKNKNRNVPFIANKMDDSSLRLIIMIIIILVQ